MYRHRSVSTPIRVGRLGPESAGFHAAYRHIWADGLCLAKLLYASPNVVSNRDVRRIIFETVEEIA